jgi:hypothetical protein
VSPLPEGGRDRENESVAHAQPGELTGQGNSLERGGELNLIAHYAVAGAKCDRRRNGDEGIEARGLAP